ncbi:hypothetical protein ScalyP_jg11976 [Parmales sp. scaly parma]|nr:hypothetical protein ScalyP_jg11976 [Parmales sp. scaly parma]
MRQATGQQRGPQSRMRTGAAPGTSAGTQAAFLPSHEVQISDRPVTGQGIAGLKPKGNGPGRQVQDSSFYIGMLRTKHTDITKEVRKIKGDIVTMEKDASQYTQLERKYEQLLKEVRGMEGNLADYNLAMDKLRTSTDPEEVVAYQKQLQVRNRNEAGEIDKVFITKQQQEKNITDLEAQISDVHRKAEEKIKRLDSAKLKNYEDLIRSSQNLQNEGSQKEQEMEQLRHKTHELEAIVRGSGMRDEYNREERTVIRLSKQFKQLEDDMEIANMDPKEAHAKLLAKVKEDQRKTTELDSRVSEINDEIHKLKRQQKELVSDTADRERGNTSNDKQKYELLFQRDAEMTQFLESFDQAKFDVLEDQKRTKGTVVALLEHISQGIGTTDVLPSQERLEEMKDEVSFKTKQLETSQQTMARLQEQRVKRIQEMEKISSLDEKIGVELGQLNEKMSTMKGDIGQFDDIEGLRARASFTKDELEKLREKYTSRKSAIKQQVGVLSALVEGEKKAKKVNETAKNLESLEQKLRHYEQNIFSLKEFIATKGKETDFESLKETCSQLVTKLNVQAIDSN